MAARTLAAKLVQVGDIPFLVDGFQFQRETVKHYVLTHFHSDHTVGLARSFASGTIYCTEETAALIVELIGVNPELVRPFKLLKTFEVGDTRLTLLNANHCPGSAIVFFEDASRTRFVLHTGDCRASGSMLEQVQYFLGSRKLDELYLDTTYCGKRWCFPDRDKVCTWLKEIVCAEQAREARTLFIVGSYQIGKEIAVRAVAEAVDSSAYVEHRRWTVLKLAGWGDVTLHSGKPLWSIDKEGCRVWMLSLGSLGHDTLKQFLDSSKGAFEAVVAIRPTGWSWTKTMSTNGSAGCRVWTQNDGRTRIYSVPYSEHSSYTELRAFVDALRPRKLTPTVNSETQSGKEKVMRHFLDFVDLRADRERLDHYLHSSSASSSSERRKQIVDVLALSADASKGYTRLDASLRRSITDLQGKSNEHSETSKCMPRVRWASGVLCWPGRTDLLEDLAAQNADLVSCPGYYNEHRILERADDQVIDIEEDLEIEAAVGPPLAVSEGRFVFKASATKNAHALKAAFGQSKQDDTDLRGIDLEQQKRLLNFFEAGKQPKVSQRRPLKFRRGRRQKTKASGSAAGNPLMHLLGASLCKTPEHKSAKTLRRRSIESTASKPKRQKRWKQHKASGMQDDMPACDESVGKCAQCATAHGQRSPLRSTTLVKPSIHMVI